MSKRTEPQFHCETIEVALDSGEPRAFIWRGKKHEVERVLKAWHDFGFPLGMKPKAAGWRVRHRRDCFRVLTTDGATFEIYYDRGRKRKEWVLSNQL